MANVLTSTITVSGVANYSTTFLDQVSSAYETGERPPFDSGFPSLTTSRLSGYPRIDGADMNSKDQNAREARHTESRRVETEKMDAAFAEMGKRASENFFANRGFSAQTIRTLIASGISLPEELLLMTADEAGCIQGLGEDGLAEVKAYRERFLSAPQ
jgi:hypothetical protein